LIILISKVVSLFCCWSWCLFK